MNFFNSVPKKAFEHISAALQVNETTSYLVRDSLVQLVHPLFRFRWRGQYHRRGQVFFLQHGSDDTYIFQEIFVRRLYALPESIVLAVPTTPRNIVDLGGNVGLFGLWAMENWPYATLTAIEPDPVNAARYREFVDANKCSIEIIEACASNAEGSDRFMALGRASSSVSNNDEAIHVATVDVLPLIARADLVKIDIEGGEWNILLDSRFEEVEAPLIALEYHPQFCPSDNPRELAELCLRGAGYDTFNLFEEANGVGMLWAYRSPRP